MSSRLAAFSLVSLLALPLPGATRMTFDIQGAATAIEWSPTSFPLRYEIDQRVTQMHPNATAMVEKAFATWAELPDVGVRFQPGGVVTRGVAEAINVSVADDLLRNQGAIAITAYTFDTRTGRMLDADIRLDPSLFKGDVNAQLALEHEVGHTLGLDHSAVLTSVMYPYVGPESQEFELDIDDRIAISTIYPSDDPTLRGATLQGRLVGDEGGVFAAQVVAVNERGVPVATSLTNAAGEFTLLTVPAGRYSLYAEPLDGPVQVDALQGTWRQASGKSFPTQFYQGTIDVENGRVYGNLVLRTSGPTQLNPRILGASAPDSFSVSLTSAPVVVRPGQAVKLTVGGEGFISGMTEFEVLNPSFKRTSEFQWWGGSVSADYLVASDAQGSSSVIIVRSGNESAALTGALRVHRPASSGKTRGGRK